MKLLVSVVGAIHIGTSGWNYRHWLERFYPAHLPQSEWLSFYAKYFDTVEINNTFYHLPSIKTFNTWRETVPKNFLFALKASRFITHMKKLKAPKTSSRKLFSRMRRLDETLGPILFQLPPGWSRNDERLARFLESFPTAHRFVFEFRDASWLTRDIYELLRKHNAAFCIHDFRGERTPKEITADFTCVRMHGPGRVAYSGSYPRRALREWAEQIKEWQDQLKDVYVYFNNDVEGNAIKNGLTLRELCDS